MSPLGITMMIHFYARPEPWKNKSPAYEQLVKQFLEDGLITTEITCHDSDADYEATERGEAYIQFLMDVSIPVIKWELPK